LHEFLPSSAILQKINSIDTMFMKTFLVSALAALATAQSSALTFTTVQNPITDGEPTSLSWATNDTVSV
jgi:hypothetical protein